MTHTEFPVIFHVTQPHAGAAHRQAGRHITDCFSHLQKGTKGDVTSGFYTGLNVLKEIKDAIAAGYLLAPPHPIETWENFKEQRVKGNSVFK